MKHDDQMRFRISPGMHRAMRKMMKESGHETEAALFKALMIQAMAKGYRKSPLDRISKEKFSVADKYEARLCALYMEGIRLGNHLEMESFLTNVQEEIWLEEKGLKSQYYLCLGERWVGPHLLERIKEWHRLGILSADGLARGEHAKNPIHLENIPGFFETGSALKKKLNGAKPGNPWDDDPVTPKQIKCLEFFQLSFPREGLTKGKASRYIGCFKLIDPARQLEYKKVCDEAKAAQREKRKLKKQGKFQSRSPASSI